MSQSGLTENIIEFDRPNNTHRWLKSKPTKRKASGEAGFSGTAKFQVSNSVFGGVLTFAQILREVNKQPELNWKTLKQPRDMMKSIEATPIENQICFTAKILHDVFEYIDLRTRQLQEANEYDIIYNEAALDMKKVLLEHSKRLYVSVPFVYPGKVI